MFGKELNELVLNNITDKNILSKEFLLELKNILIRDERFAKVFKDFIFKPVDALGIYARPYIFLNSGAIYNYIENISQRYDYDFNSTYVKNIKYLEVIIHELVHAFQQIRFGDDRDFLLNDSRLAHNGNFKSGLFRNNLIASKYGDKLYDKYHDIFPDEYEASSISTLYLLEIHNQMDQQYRDKMCAYVYDVLCELFKHYKIENGRLVSPTEQFYRIARLGHDHTIYDFSQYNLLSQFCMGVVDNIESINKVLNESGVLGYVGDHTGLVRTLIPRN